MEEHVHRSENFLHLFGTNLVDACLYKVGIKNSNVNLFPSKVHNIVKFTPIDRCPEDTTYVIENTTMHTLSTDRYLALSITDSSVMFLSAFAFDIFEGRNTYFHNIEFMRTTDSVLDTVILDHAYVNHIAKVSFRSPALISNSEIFLVTLQNFDYIFSYSVIIKL